MNRAGGVFADEFDHWSVVGFNVGHELIHTLAAADRDEAFEEVPRNALALPIVSDREGQLGSPTGGVDKVAGTGDDLFGGSEWTEVGK